MKKITVAVLTLAFCAYAAAQSSGGDFEVLSHTIAGGGGRSSGGDFTLTGTIGQHDASSSVSTGGNIIAAGGFWAKALDLIFSDGFEDN